MARLAAASALLVILGLASCGGDPTPPSSDASPWDTAGGDAADAAGTPDAQGDLAVTDLPAPDVTPDGSPDLAPTDVGPADVADVPDQGPGDGETSDSADVPAVPDGAGDLDGAGAPVCGDGVQEGDEACDDGDANSDTAADACRTSCQPAHCGDGVKDTGEACDDGNDNDLDGCTAACELGATVPAPGPGELVIAELMINPEAANDPVGEWIELANTAVGDRNLTGCVVRDEGTDHFLLGDPGGALVAPAGGRVVLAVSGDVGANGGVDADFVYGAGMLLDNLADEVIVECAGLEVDRVAYAVPAWDLPHGASLSLDPGSLDAAANDAVGAWCFGQDAYGAGGTGGDLGTPGEPNPACPAPDTTVDLCVLAGAPTETGFVGVEHSLEVHVTEAGVTDLSAGVDVPSDGPALVVEVGVGPHGVVPEDATSGWQWSPATGLEGWQNAAGVDGYGGSVVPGAAGTFDAAARVSRDGGVTWTLCDRGAGSADGYAPADAIELTVIEDPCAGVTCDSPPPATCAADQLTVLVPSAQGTCVPVGPGDYGCEYPPVGTSCADQGLLCQDGACQGAVAPPPSGGLAVTEVMPSPSAPDYLGEWFELTNVSPSPVNLAGCVITDGAADSAVLDGPLVLASGGRVVVGRSGNAAVNGGLAPDVVLGDGFVLDKADRLTVTCVGVVAADLQWSVLWPFGGGIAMQLSPFADATQAATAAAWCEASTPFGAGDLGSPGEPNPPCPGDVVPVKACRVAEDATFSGSAGVTTELHATVTVAGVTDVTTGQDAGAGVLVRVGYAPDGPSLGADPEDYDWHAAAPTAGWVDDDEPGADGYHVRLRAPAAGDWRVVARASADGGHTWTLCDGTPQDAVFTPSEAPLWQVAPSACDPDPCGAPAATSCDGDWVVAPKGLAACSLDTDAGGLAVCSWASDPVENCADSLASCLDGGCVGGPAVPGPGDVIFSELAVIPAAGPLGEWVELTNTTDGYLDLAGCALRADGAGEGTLQGPSGQPLYMGPHAVWLAARTLDPADNAGLPPVDATYAGVALPNEAGRVVLSCGGADVDAVSWGADVGLPAPVHGTLSLSGSWQAAGLGGTVERWCQGTVADAPDVPPGTPGAPNPLCPAPDPTVDDCALVGFVGADGAGGLTSAQLTAGEEAHVQARLLDAWVTDATSGTDAAPGVALEVGWGPSGTTPDDAWTWQAASPDLGWDDGAAPGWEHWDQWDGVAAWHDVGSWDVAARVTVDGGATWTLCDADGAANGYDPALAAHVTVTAGAGEPL